MMDLKKSTLDYDPDTQRKMNSGSSTFASTSSAIRDCCGGPSNSRARSATINYRNRQTCMSFRQKSATLGNRSKDTSCDILKSGNIQQAGDKILWRFDCDIPSPNNPDIINRTVPETIETRTTTL